MSDTIRLVASGNSFTGWETFEFTSAINEAVRACKITVSEIASSGSGSGHEDGQFFSLWNFPPNTPIQVYISDDLILDGYVDDYEPDISKDSHLVSLTMRGKGMDWVDTSVVHPTHQFENQKVEEIAKQLDACGVGVSSDVDTGAPVEKFNARQGSTPHKEVMRLCQQRKLVQMGQADGSVKITRAGATRHSGVLRYGQPGVTHAKAKLSARDRFSEYIALGQDSTRLFNAPKGTAKDSEVPRYRPKVIIDQAQTTPAYLQQRAQWERSRAAGSSAHATLTVTSFRDSAGVIWEPTYLVAVDYTPIKLKQDMVLEKVRLFRNADEGSGAELSLVDPRTYAGEQTDAESDDPQGLYDQDESQ